MTEKREYFLREFRKFIEEKQWQIISEKDIEHGLQVLVFDGVARLPVNFYHTGKIVAQGRLSDTKTTITEWVNLVRAGMIAVPASSISVSKNRISKYFVLPENFAKIRDVIHGLPGETLEKDVTGPADVYRIENKINDNRVTISQYNSGTLMVQGLSSTLFDSVCDVLDLHLTQSLSERASRYLPSETERNAVTVYLEQPDAENESAQWLYQHIDKKILDFLHENDRRTLLAAAGVRNAFEKSTVVLPDYSVVVMPFAKPYEGFLTKLSIHLGLTTESNLAKTANEILVGGWLISIKERIPDPKRYRDISVGLEAAWNSRHKAVHSDAYNSLSVLRTFADAEDEIATILRAMKRAYVVFVEEEKKLKPDVKKKDKAKASLSNVKKEENKFENISRDGLYVQLKKDGYHVRDQQEGRKNEWEVITKPLSVIAPRAKKNCVIIKGKGAQEFCEKYQSFLRKSIAISDSKIGVDESGKGDLFGPLVIAGVIIQPDTEILLAKSGVRDSKELSDSVIMELAETIRKNCVIEVVVLLPPEYNDLYKKFGNLNLLLAWGHAQVISRLSREQKVTKAISDQFGEESLVINALKAENCDVFLEQRHHAESDISVAAASIIARAEFITAMRDYTYKAGINIPLGTSATEVKEIGIEVYRRWGKQGLERIAKMHFKTIQEIMRESK